MMARFLKFFRFPELFICWYFVVSELRHHSMVTLPSKLGNIAVGRKVNLFLMYADLVRCYLTQSVRVQICDEWIPFLGQPFSECAIFPTRVSSCSVASCKNPWQSGRERASICRLSAGIRPHRGFRLTTYLGSRPWVQFINEWYITDSRGSDRIIFHGRADLHGKNILHNSMQSTWYFVNGLFYFSVLEYVYTQRTV